MPYNLPEQKGRSILQVALDVHMTNTGSYERSDTDQQEDIQLLRRKLDTWEPPYTNAFDDAVRILIEMVWLEYHHEYRIR